MFKTSQILAIVAEDKNEVVKEALSRIAEVIERHDGYITISANQTVQDVDPCEILVGTEVLRLRGIEVNIADLKIETRIPPNHGVNIEDLLSGEACFISYGGTNGRDRQFLSIIGREAGKIAKILCAQEALDVAATSSLNMGTTLLLSENSSQECLVVDPCSVLNNENGIYLGGGEVISWDEVSALTIQDTLSLAIGRNRMLTLTEG